MEEDIKNLIKKVLKELKIDFDAFQIIVDYPKNDAFGDYTTNVAMVLGKTLKKNPMEIAESIISKMKKISAKSEPAFDWEVVKPGYINFYLSKKYLQDKVSEINKAGGKYGNSQIGKGIKVNDEFISANPTGPLHLGNGRGGFLGDVISNVLKKTGYQVRKEYYVNDAGEQVIKLGHSVLKDEDAVYAGEYIDKLNKKLEDIKDVKKIGEKSADIILNEIIKKTVAEEMKIEEMNYISERDLYTKKKVDEALKILKRKKLTYESEGALWLKTSKFGDEKDRVLKKQDGNYTYFASDCGYLLYKIGKKFNRIIEIWGADHHGYIQRFKAAARALGFEGEIEFIIVQLVKLVKDGKEVRMSKRAGNVVYIDELIGKVGYDVTRFFFLMYSPDTHMNFDLKLAQEKSEKNPVYYVQYAHARISSILAKYKVESSKYKAEKEATLSLLTHGKELNLIRELNKFPALIEEISATYEVHKLPYYAVKLADKFHSFYNDLIVLDEKNPGQTRARLELARAVRIVLAETLRLIGVSAPNKM
jgi:arginyl-tRNA synthetase